MTGSSGSQERVCVDGKFFRVGHRRFHAQGVTYGTFAKNEAGERFPEPAVAGTDLDLIRALGANTLRVYDIPPRWLLDAGAARGLRLFVGIPWGYHSCFLETRNSRREARTAVVSAVRALAGHPAVFALALANEIPPDLVRWYGAAKVGGFIDELIAAAHDTDPGCLCTYANYPTTEFLQPRRVDFVTFNVFLHESRALANYLARLHAIAHDRPLVVGECGADARREGEERQATILADNLRTGARAGLAGRFVFSLTDDWVHNGCRVDDWEMGLTRIDRTPRPAYTAVQTCFAEPPPTPAPSPRVSVVVAAYNAAATLADCLESLLHLEYPNYEVVLVDDGSTDDTPRISAKFPQVRTLRHEANLGLSLARNLGIRAATGDIIAFTDADCRADRDWLRLLVIGMLDLRVEGIGGPNLLPPDDSAVAAAVMVSPGGPAHVMLDDHLAEHLPGCNMAFWRWALEGVGGFDSVFHRAGDDVDICWRIQRNGGRLGFAPAAFVWHHRRATVRDYLRQQAGYGEAEALLVAKHPEHFNAIGGAQWQGRICTPSPALLPWHRSVIYRGIFATAPFQTLYTPAADGLLPLLTSIEYHVLFVLPLVIFAFVIGWLWPLAVIAFLLPPILSVAAAARTVLPRDRHRWWSRPLVAVLFCLQPMVRGLARYRARLNLRAEEPRSVDSLEATSHAYSGSPAGNRAYWSNEWRDRREWIERLERALENRCWPNRADAGWSDFDLEVFGSRWASLAVTTVTEANHDRSQTLRCRLRPRWTLTAQTVFWGTLAVVVLLFGLCHVNWRGLWVPVATQGALAWFLRHQGRLLQCRLGVLLDEVAREWKLMPVDPSTGASHPRAAVPTDSPGLGNR